MDKEIAPVNVPRAGHYGPVGKVGGPDVMDWRFGPAS